MENPVLWKYCMGFFTFQKSFVIRESLKKIIILGENQRIGKKGTGKKNFGRGEMCCIQGEMLILKLGEKIRACGGDWRMENGES